MLNGLVGAGFHADTALDAVINAGCHGLTILELVNVHRAVFNAFANAGTFIVVYLYLHIPR